MLTLENKVPILKKVFGNKMLSPFCNFFVFKLAIPKLLALDAVYYTLTYTLTYTYTFIHKDRLPHSSDATFVCFLSIGIRNMHLH